MGGTPRTPDWLPRFRPRWVNVAVGSVAGGGGCQELVQVPDGDARLGGFQTHQLGLVKHRAEEVFLLALFGDEPLDEVESVEIVGLQGLDCDGIDRR